MSERMNNSVQVPRRHFLHDCGIGLGKIAAASLLAGKVPRAAKAADSVAERANPLAPRQPHFKAKAKAVIHLFMAGAPSQLDLFDYKPKLAEIEGKPIPPEVIGGQRYARTGARGFGDNQPGQCGLRGFDP